MSTEQSQNSQPEEGTYKGRLDHAAHEARNPASAHEASHSPSLVEKIVEYVPAASKLLGSDTTSKEQQEERAPAENPQAPPLRPEHDQHIEEFVREQHRSKKPDGTLGA